ncbi:hypothetical protein GCM10009678_51890 [Actinomadura kijaniata]|uniref:Guanylate cyclase domain-containing protein n=1 Tax=Actinomadura namibiensis TaxID=182080 RepID=A0A7W3LKX7_ACTNM|nr:hypothetical protein [Actinomadura namibiensis]MBA8950032.1 hypothetical protein [Actinomadura namibiensis]
MSMQPVDQQAPPRTVPNAASPVASPAFPPVQDRVYTSVLAVDIVAFGDRGRDDGIRRHLRERLYAHLREVFAMTRLPWEPSHREDRGDGVLVVLPPRVPFPLLLDPLAHHLHAVLRHGNRMASDAARMRLRLAVHAGFVQRDDHGVVSEAVNHLFRLLDSAPLRAAAAASAADLCMIVSDRLYSEVGGEYGFSLLDRYRPVEITNKETRTRGWIWLPPGECAHDGTAASPAL